MSVSIGDNPPTNPADGDMWVTRSGKLSIYEKGYWNEPETTSEGPFRWAIFAVAGEFPFCASLASPERLRRSVHNDMVCFCRDNFGSQGVRWDMASDPIWGGVTEVVFLFRHEADRLIFYMHFSESE